MDSDADAALRLQVLLWLAYCHGHAGDPGACLSCVEALHQAGSELAGLPEAAALQARCAGCMSAGPDVWPGF